MQYFNLLHILLQFIAYMLHIYTTVPFVFGRGKLVWERREVLVNWEVFSMAANLLPPKNIIFLVGSTKNSFHGDLNISKRYCPNS